MSPTPPERGRRVSEYILEERLGAGGFGEVWKAVHAFLPGEVVALKIPTDPAFIETLRKEGAILYALRGEHVVAVKGLDPYADPPYLAMEYVDGKSLRQVLEERSTLPLEDALRVYRQALLALQTAHRQGVIHRDVKPENILLDAAGVVKLTDFGLGRAVEATTSGILQSGGLQTLAQGGIAGTLRYMSPEQREGGPVDARTDLYSLGMVLFEMLAGEAPQGAELPSDLVRDLPGWVDRVFSRCYTRRDRRYTNATEALEDLDALQNPKRPDVELVGPVRRAPKPPPVLVPRDPASAGPRPLWMLPFLALHAVFGALAAGAGNAVRSVRDGGGAAGLAMLLLTLLAAGGVVLLVYRSQRQEPPERPRPLRTAPGSRDLARLAPDASELARAWRQRDWRSVWNRLSSRARSSVAEEAGYEPLDARWISKGWRLLAEEMDRLPETDPPGILGSWRRTLDAGDVRVVPLTERRARVEAGRVALEWILEDGAWKLDGPPEAR